MCNEECETYICIMSSLLPFEVLQDIVQELGVGQQPLNVNNVLYRPLVFQVNATGMYVFSLIPLTYEVTDAFEEINKQYDKYLDGEDTAIIFFRAENPNDLKTLVIDWYKQNEQH